MAETMTTVDHTMTYEATIGNIAKYTFARLASERNYRFSRYVKWPVDHDWEKATAQFNDEAAVISIGQFGGIIVLDEGDLLAHIDIGMSEVSMSFRCDDADMIVAFIERMKGLLPEVAKIETKVDFDFWSNTQQGPVCTRRKLEVPTWEAIAPNYATEVRTELDWLMSREDGDDLRDGKLVLWRGQPGTGKTYALRALAREWRDWAAFYYVTDPEKFFGDAAYMNQVLLNSGTSMWKVLILEDSGELLSPTAKADTGQGLSRLLNMVDGILGQGLKFLVLVTTNEDIKTLHAAVQRDGRCAQRLEFMSFDHCEAQKWLEAHDCNSVQLESGYYSVSSLYAKLRGQELPGEKKRKVGFVT